MYIYILYFLIIYLISLSPDPLQLILLILGVLFIRSLVLYPFVRKHFRVKDKPGRSGYIYCFFDLGTIVPAVKIGRETEKGSRLRQHKTSAPLGIICLYNVKAVDAVYSESYLHARYFLTRIPRKEWIIITPLVLFDSLIFRLFGA